jgi:hypothetical protein
MSSTRIHRHVKAPRARGYSALVDADAVPKWKVPDGMTSNVEEFQKPGRAIHRHLRRSRLRQPNPNRHARHRGRHEQGGEPRLFARPWPVVKLFREYMERNLRPDPVPDAIWALPASASGK